MELKHDRMKKEARTEVANKPFSKWGSVAVLAAGLAMLPSAAVANEKPAKDEIVRVPGSVSLIQFKKGKQVVKEGDLILKAEFALDKAGFYEVKVAKIDGKGVELGMQMRVFMSESASNEKNPWRVGYGETKYFPEKYPLFGFKAEKGKPGTAVITFIPDRYIEMEKAMPKPTHHKPAAVIIDDG